MKKRVFVIVVLGLFVLLLVGCGGDKTVQEERVIKVGATPVPHAELLKLVKDDMAKRGIRLEIVEFTDYVQPNLALASGEIDANFFQHVPYLEKFSEDHNLDLTYLAKIHIEPMGIYSSKIATLEELKPGSRVAIPNDPTNGGRALLLLAKAGLITLEDGVGIKATVNDITDNPDEIEIVELEAATLPRILEDVAAAVINTNYALEAGFVPVRDALYIEDSNSPFANVIAVKGTDLENEDLLELVKVLQSDNVREFIAEEYEGAVVPAF